MERMLGPDEAYRLVYLPDGTARAQGQTAALFADSAGTVPADVLTTDGHPVPGAVVTVDAYSQIPIVRFPDGADTIWCSVNGGPLVPLLARMDDRLDALAAAVRALVAAASGNGVTLDGSTLVVDVEATAGASIDTDPAVLAVDTDAASAAVVDGVDPDVLVWTVGATASAAAGAGLTLDGLGIVIDLGVAAGIVLDVDVAAVDLAAATDIATDGTDPDVLVWTVTQPEWAPDGTDPDILVWATAGSGWSTDLTDTDVLVYAA